MGKYKNIFREKDCQLTSITEKEGNSPETLLHGFSPFQAVARVCILKKSIRVRSYEDLKTLPTRTLQVLLEAEYHINRHEVGEAIALNQGMTDTLKLLEGALLQKTWKSTSKEFTSRYFDHESCVESTCASIIHRSKKALLKFPMSPERAHVALP